MSDPSASPDDLLAALDDAVARLRADPACPSLALRTTEGEGWSIGDGRPVVSASRAEMLAWLTRGDPTGIDAPDATHLPTIPAIPTSPPTPPHPSTPEARTP